MNWQKFMFHIKDFKEDFRKGYCHFLIGEGTKVLESNKIAESKEISREATSNGATDSMYQKLEGVSSETHYAAHPTHPEQTQKKYG